MQEQQNCFHKAWNVDIEIVSNGTKKIRFVSPFRKKLCFGIVIFRLGGKNCIVKNEKWIVFCELDTLIRTLLEKFGNTMQL